MKAFLPLLLIAHPIYSATWYAAADGTSTNGTSALPWAVNYAITNTNPHLQPGDTVLFKAGTFVGTETNAANVYSKQIVFRKSGTPGAKITYQSETLWGFSFDGGPLFPNSVSNLVFKNFRVFFSTFTNRYVIDELPTVFPAGPQSFAEGVDILHNLIENTGHPGIGSWSSTRGKNIAGNIIRFIGQESDAGFSGSGMYLQNENNSAEALIRGNISYFNYTTGMKAYGTDNVYGFRFLHNISAENVEAGIFYHQDQTDSQGVQIISNFVWSTEALRLGYVLGNANPSNAIIAGNYAVTTNTTGPLSVVDGWAGMTVTNNTLVNAAFRQVVFLEESETNFVTSHNWDRNSYYSGASIAYGTLPFYVGPYPGEKSFIEWTNRIQNDTHSTVVTGAPNATVSFVFAPSSDTNFVHVAVFNWSTNATTTVNLSAYFKLGSRLAIYDAQDIPNACMNITFSGSTIPLDLTRTNRATMLGTFTYRSNSWAGFDPRFRAFVVFREGDSVVNATTVNVGAL